MNDRWDVKKKILIVDDQILNLDVLQAVLDDVYDLRFAVSGEIALEFIDSGFCPDMILLDILMPGIDGYDVCRRVKADDATKDIPIIFMTSLDSEEDEAKGLSLGAVDFISKPFKPALLKARIETHLQLKMKRDELLSVVGQKNRELEESFAQIAQKEAYLQSIFKSAPVGIGLTVSRKFKWVNQQFAEMLGYSNAELLDQDTRMLYANEQEYEQVGQLKYDQIARSGTGSVDTQLVTKDGSVIDVLIRSTPLDLEDWSAGVIFTVLDISERVKQQAELTKSEQRLKQAQSIAQIGHWEYDVANDRLFWSDEIYRIFAVDKACFSPSIENFIDRIHPDDRAQVSRRYQDSLVKQEPYDIIHRLLLDDGEVKYVHEKCDTRYDDDGRPLISRGTVQDVTQIQLARIALEESEEYQKMLSDASFEAIFLSRKGLCLGQNLTAEKLFGYGFDEAYGRPGTDWIVESEREKVREKMLHNAQAPYETIALRKDGTTFPAEVQARQMLFRGQEIRVTALRDITTRKLQESIVDTQLHLSQFSSHHHVEDVLGEFLNRTESLTESRAGLFYDVTADGNALSLAAWSSSTHRYLSDFPPAEQLCPIDRAGVWGDCVRSCRSQLLNDFEAASHERDFPEFDIPITRQLIVPILRDDQVVAILGVANKATEYTSNDVEIVEKLADLTWDIIVKKRAEENIAKAKEEWEATFDAMEEMVTIHDRDMRIIRANKAAHDYWGISYGDLNGRTCCEAFWHREEACTGCPLVKTICDHKTHSKTFCFGDPQRVLSVTTSPIRFSEDPSDYYICVSSDVTQHSLMETALRTREEQLRTLINATPDIICFKDAQGRWLEANQAGLELFDLADVDFHGQTSRELAQHTSPICREAFNEYCSRDEEAWQAGKACRDLEAILAKDGQERIFDLIRVPLFEDNGERKALVTLGRDITEQKQLQKEADQSSRLASLGELAAGIAHEINNPNALTLYNSDILDQIFTDLKPLLADYEPPDSRQLFAGLSYHDALEEIAVLFPAIQDSAQRIKRIVNDLRDFARQDNSDMQESVDLNAVVQSSIRLVNNAIKKATDAFILESAQDLPLISGIRGRLEQVVVNLLVNACQALDNREQKIIVRTLYDDDQDKVKIIVEDEGCGISEKMKKHVFEPFVTSKREQGGTGLGLSVSARIVKEHHGDLELESSPGQGTTVTLSLTPDRTV